MAFPNGKLKFRQRKASSAIRVLHSWKGSVILNLAHRTCVFFRLARPFRAISLADPDPEPDPGAMEATKISLLSLSNPNPLNWTKKIRFGSPKVETPEAMTVFEFDDFRAYLNYVRDHYPGLRRPITLERWCKKLNYRSPRSIAMVLKGQRLPSEELVLAFSQDLKHSENERRYFELLVRKEKHKDNVPASVAEELHRLSPKQIRRKPLEGEVFRYVSDWQHYVILQLFSTPDFKASQEDCVAWVEKRLGGSLDAEEIRKSLELLERLKFIEKDPANGRYRLCTEDPILGTEEVPSAAGRKHLTDQMEQAKEALHRQSLSDREFTCVTLRVNRKRLPEIKKAIREFRDKFDKDFFDDAGSDVCQLNVQFFFHTVED